MRLGSDVFLVMALTSDDISEAIKAARTSGARDCQVSRMEDGNSGTFTVEASSLLSK